MKKQLSLLFLQIAINLVATQTSLYINELEIGTTLFEVKSVSSTAIQLSDYALYKVDNSGGTITLKSGGAFTGFSLAANQVKQTSLGDMSIDLGTASNYAVAVILYQRNGEPDVTSVNNLQPGRVLDALVYTTGPAMANPFTTLIPGWTGNVFVSSAPRISRCTDDQFTASAFSQGASSFGSPNPCAGGSGDPHFIQQVLDKNSKTLQTICYDVNGKSSNRISILHDFQTKTMIEGILKDDFYMHIMRISISNQIFQIFTDYIEFPNGKMMTWKYTDSPIEYGSLTFQITNKEISLLAKGRSNQLSFGITKEYNDLTGWHLNIGFENLNTTQSRFGGMMGDIGKKNFEFSESIQNRGGAVLKYNNHMIQASLKVRSGFKCWFVAFEDIIYPKTSLNYVY